MIVRQNAEDKCYPIRMQRCARCVGECGAKWLEPGALAWSYLANPCDGNYVECGPCRYGCEPVE
jgi:hypothetical protein